MVLEYEYNNGQTDGLLCGWDNPATSSDDENYHSRLYGFTSMWKPVIYPECAMSECMDIDHTGFVIDLLIAPFSGHASSGMNWGQYSRTNHWNYFGVINAYLDSHVFNGIDLGNEIWDPGYASSRYEPDPIDLNNFHAKNAEVVYLSKVTAPSSKLVGVIRNRSWNNYSIYNCGIEPPDLSSEVFLNEISGCGYENDPITIKHEYIGLHQFTIRYYHP